MKTYYFKKISDDGIEWEFTKKFPDAFKADRWATKQWKKWWEGRISFRIIFPC